MKRKNWITVVVVMVAVMVLLVPAFGFSASQTRARDHQDTDHPIRDRLQDGDCKDEVSAASVEINPEFPDYPTPPEPFPGNAVDPDLDRIQLRLQDCTCKE